MAYIRNATLETVTVDCDACGVENIISRREDVGSFEPLVSAYVLCQACRSSIRMTGDLVAPAYGFLLQDADAQFANKRYNATVVLLGQAWEAFLRLFVFATYAHHPFLKQVRRPAVGELNSLIKAIGIALSKPEKFAFDKLRNLVANTAIHNIQPITVAEAKIDIPRITSEAFWNRPSDKLVESIASNKRRELVRELLTLSVGDLRNRCVHHAYAPTREEALRCREEEIVFLYTLKREFSVGDFTEIQCGAV